MNTPTQQAVDAATAAKMIGISRTTWFAWVKNGTVPAAKLRHGKVVRWTVDQVTAVANGQSPNQSTTA